MAAHTVKQDAVLPHAAEVEYDESTANGKLFHDSRRCIFTDRARGGVAGKGTGEIASLGSKKI